jgi:hypothetical protein
MDERTNRPTPRHIIDAVDASVRDLAEGNTHDAQAVQVEANRMLTGHERAKSATPTKQKTRSTRRTRTV